MTDTKPRARDLGLPFPGTPGPLNAITDVAGIAVGFTTLTDHAIGLRTGVTALLPRADSGTPRPVMAGHFSLNGNGEMTGTHWIDDAGYFFGPVLVTNTHAIGACHSAATRWMIDRYPDHFAGHAWAMPVVAETYDGRLNDINAMRVTPDHARAALASARGGPVAEGNTGGGNGMIAYGFKAGTGTASRRVTIGRDYTLGALVQANHGLRDWLTILGKPLGRLFPETAPPPRETGSIIVILATDAPLSALSLRALAKRAALGIARSGTAGGNSSGDIFLAFSTADAGPMPEHAGPLCDRQALNPHHIDPLYLAAVEATDEAIVNALVAAEPVPTFRPAGQILPAIDTAALAALFRSDPAAK
ncbi:P1 family peptidase [Paragemmobacter straminiformis]|uniref:P1 family peptidase n=1 Tax=Paragemmobacter straminiformis TaxID=2045119 RepID=A0A842IBN6_9RHOB|nr:P1 family peptidase [Gemmobacter straminiformis]MBC2836823.1 P1 family peptidase [Gemmobacter straminiformis]